MIWADDLSYIWASLLASIVTFAAYRFISRRSILSALLYLDAMGIALFAVQGTAKAWTLGFGLPLAPIILAIITAIGGRLIRDVPAGRDNLLMKRELYAILVSLGYLLYAALMPTTSIQPNLVALICMGLISVSETVRFTGSSRFPIGSDCRRFSRRMSRYRAPEMIGMNPPTTTHSHKAWTEK